MAVDRLAKYGVWVHQQHVLWWLFSFLVRVVEPVLQCARLVVRRVAVVHVVVLWVSVVRMDVRWPNVRTSITLWVIARHQSRDVSGLQHLLVRVEEAH